MKSNVQDLINSRAIKNYTGLLNHTIYLVLSDIEEGDEEHGRAVDLKESYLRSNERQTTLAECERAAASSQSQANGVKFPIFSATKYTTNALWQVLLISVFIS